MILPQPSLEQKNAIDKLADNNIVIDSVAGSGKTTTNLHISMKYPNKKILLLTYNAKLKLETRDKVKQLNIHNIEVHSYHSFCYKYYDNKCRNDGVMRKIINNEIKPKMGLNFDIIIIDECQDMTPLYYELVWKIFTNNNKKDAYLCILGDKNQSIYDFNQADERFIVFADKLFTFNSKSWTKCNLSYSFRITHEMAEFINRCMLGTNRIKSSKVTDIKPRYIICDCFSKRFGSGGRAYSEVLYYINLGYSYEDIFIISPSVRNQKSPVRQLANDLSNKGYPVFVPLSDEEKLDDQILSGKIVFSTYHQVKGLERKVVIVFNFDNSYFHLYKKNKNPKYCPNELYVATTRAKERLTMFHHYDNDYLPFLNTAVIKKYTDFFMDTQLKVTKFKSSRNIDTYVTDIYRHVPQEVITKCCSYLKTKIINEPGDIIDIPAKTQQKYGYENVSEITGTAIPAFFDYKIKNKLSLLERLVLGSIHIDASADSESEESEEEINEQMNMDLVLSQINPNNITEDTIHTIDNTWGSFNKFMLYVANRWNSFTSGYVYKVNQIVDYGWLGEDNMIKSIDRLKNLNISEDSKFEIKFSIENENELLNRRLIGYTDCIDSNNVYEFKCVTSLTDEHLLQIGLYMYLIEVNRYNNMIDESIKTIRPGDIVTFIIGNKKHYGAIIRVDNHIVTLCKKDGEIMSLVKSKILKNKTYVDEYKNNNIGNVYYLYNILSNKLIEVSCDLANLRKMMEYLVHKKYVSDKKLDNKDFIKEMDSISSNYKLKNVD
jgi:hypothetical protein